MKSLNTPIKQANFLLKYSPVEFKENVDIKENLTETAYFFFMTFLIILNSELKILINLIHNNIMHFIINIILRTKSIFN